MEQAETRARVHKTTRDAEVSRVLWHVLFLNLLVAGLKLVFGYLSGSISMIADGFHSTLDGSSNVVGLVGLKMAGKEPDEDHPYGHRKFEALAALGISIFLLLTCYEIVTTVISRFNESHTVDPRPVTYAVMLFTITVNYGVSRYEQKHGKRLKSLILLADAKHTQSDVITSLGVIVSLVAASLNFPALDLVMAIGIAIFIAYLAYSIVSSSFSILADAQAVDPDEVVRLALGVEGVTGAHRVRSRGIPGDIHVDLHLHVPPDITIAKAHDLAHQASHRILDSMDGITDVVIHVEPDDEHEH